MNVCDFGAVLKQLRKSHNLTQQELGLHIGLSKAVISKYENGMGYPTFDILILIADYFGVTTDYLLGVEKGKTKERFSAPLCVVDCGCFVCLHKRIKAVKSLSLYTVYHKSIDLHTSKIK